MLVHNDGPCDASGVVLDLTLPTGLSFLSDQPSDSDATTFAAGILSSLIGDLKSGEVSLTVVVQPTTNSPTRLPHRDRRRARFPDLDPSNNSVALQTQVANASDLSFETTSFPSMTQVGQPFTYVMTLDNEGPSDDPGVTFQQMLPAGLRFVSATMSPPGQMQPAFDAFLSGSFASLPTGAVMTLTVQAIPTMGTSNGMMVSSSIQGSNFDPNPTNNATTSSCHAVRWT